MFSLYSWLTLAEFSSTLQHWGGDVHRWVPEWVLELRVEPLISPPGESWLDLWSFKKRKYPKDAISMDTQRWIFHCYFCWQTAVWRKPKDRSCKLAKSCMLWVQHWPRPKMLFQLKSLNLLKNSSRHVLKATSGEHKNVFCKSGSVFPLRISKQHKNHEATFDLFLFNTTCLQCCPLPAALFKHWQNKFRLFPSKAVQTRIKLTSFRPD